jgi:hypothetical protein
MIPRVTLYIRPLQWVLTPTADAWNGEEQPLDGGRVGRHWGYDFLCLRIGIYREETVQ